mgnify:CR=1 FL=1
MHERLHLRPAERISIIEMHPSLLESQSSNNFWYLGPSTAIIKGLLSDDLLSFVAACNWKLFMHASFKAQVHKS